MKGVTSIIEAIIKSKKPIVGHNCYFDLVFLYTSFIGDLTSYNKFKSDIRTYFCEIYDTKYISNHEYSHIFSGTRLDEL